MCNSTNPPRGWAQECYKFWWILHWAYSVVLLSWYCVSPTSIAPVFTILPLSFCDLSSQKISWTLQKFKLRQELPSNNNCKFQLILWWQVTVLKSRIESNQDTWWCIRMVVPLFVKKLPTAKTSAQTMRVGPVRLHICPWSWSKLIPMESSNCGRTVVYRMWTLKWSPVELGWCGLVSNSITGRWTSIDPVCKLTARLSTRACTARFCVQHVAL